MTDPVTTERLRAALEKIVRADFNCTPRQMGIAMQEHAREALYVTEDSAPDRGMIGRLIEELESLSPDGLAYIRLLPDARKLSDILARTATPVPLPDLEAKAGVMLGYDGMRSGGRCDWQQLREAVSEANVGTRDHAQPLRDDIYPGHEMVAGINYNSLDRIVTAFVDAALKSNQSAEGEARATSPGSLLRQPTASAPPGCHCGTVCMAPVIMGRQQPCRRAPPAPTNTVEGGEL